ncbi:hypothetical protein J2X65_003530 [Ancylobacter sp. 3268]|uniref:hypothetical protein n=1 Tax=Ancylobacter sp. 3268 TaxID=2817752 RepID=UPI0028584FD7|nr:hypothetical protein [Ancylobacter sp. 3268]MDR6954162.1 hypothetical protein [Ancylobacter sp. 3268]
MPIFDIFVTKSGVERHSVNAASFADALKLFHFGETTIKDDVTSDIAQVIFEDRETGARLTDEQIEAGASENAEPVVRSYGVRLWGTFRGCATTEVEATSFEEAMAKAAELEHLYFGFSLEDGIEGDQTMSVFGPADDAPDDEDAWGGDGTEIDKRDDGEPFSWDAVNIVKDLAKASPDGNTEIIMTLSTFIDRAKNACSKES